MPNELLSIYTYFFLLRMCMFIPYLFLAFFFHPPHLWWSPYSTWNFQSNLAVPFHLLPWSVLSVLPFALPDYVSLLVKWSFFISCLRNISHFFVSSSIAISSGLSLFYVDLPNLTAIVTSVLVILILQMFLHSHTIFWISSSLLV